MRKKLLLFVVTLLAVATFGVVQLTAKAAIDYSRDCDKYAIIYCGALNEKEFHSKFNNDTKYKDHTKVYAAFGIKKADVTGMVGGVVWRNGNVTINDKIVATGARDGARNLGGTPIAGTSGAAITSVSTFGSEGQAAMIKMVNGVFKFAIITSCGNPVTAHPKLPPVPPKPPKPPVVPTAVCDRLTLTRISRTQVKAVASPAKVTNGGKVIAYNYYFGDNTKQTTTATSLTHNYPNLATGKTYTITLTVTVQLGNVKKDITAATCKGTFPVDAVPPVPVYSCDLLTVTKINRTEFKFETKTTVKNATVKTITYVIRDAAGKEIRTTSPAYTNAIVGKYTVQALVTVTVNGKDITLPANANCTKPFEVEKLPETPTATCDGLAVDQISETDLSRTFTGGATVAGGATITGYTLDFGDGTTEPIASTSDKITSMHTYKEAKEYTAKLSVNVKLNGKDEVKTSKECEVKFTISPKVCTTPNGETFPEGDKRCTPCPVPGKEDFPKDSPECKADCTTPGHENNPECVETPPTTPPELPHTGMSDGIVALVGAGSLIAAVGYYVASRRALLG
ncbi:MAG TPA: PKD domain-containing protein [Candidatus Saccharimonadales bacterium]|nr:PKD domain-containing protein [Candidatus Saccharimonadales bacterium]